MPLLHEARHSASPMSSLPPSRPALREPRHRGPAESVSPLSRPPATPPQDGSSAHSLYSCGSLSYEGVRFSTPVRSRTLSSSTPSSHASPSRLPIGSPARASGRRGNHRARPSVPTGLGLGDLEKLALAPSPQADASREERAQRRRAVHFNSHAHFSEALRLTLSQRGSVSPKGGDKPRDQRGEIEEVPREQPGAQDDEDGDFFDDGDFSWEAESPSPGDTSALRSSSMHELAAAFPSPPKSAPEFPLSLFSLGSDTPPNLPLPPTPPFLRTARSPHIYANTDLVDNRMVMFDPEESMARLEESMAKLEGFGPAPDAPEPACFFDDEDEEDMAEVQLDSDSERNPHRTFLSQVPEDVSPPLAGSDSTDATSPMSDVQSPATDIVDPNSPELDSDVEARLERLLRCLSPTSLERTGFAGSSPSVASSATASSPRTPSASSPLAPPSIELLPEFDFEKTRHVHHNHGRSHRRRSSSLSNPIISGWQSFAKSGMGLDAKPLSATATATPNDVRASSSTAASSASAYSSAAGTSASGSSPGAGHARTPSAEYRSRGIQTQQPARPESPLRKARSTPFIRRPARYYEPAQPILQQKRAVAPPLPPLPALPPLPPVPPPTGPAYLPGSLGLARYAAVSPSTPREAERTGARASAVHVSPYAPPDGQPSWRRAHNPVGTPAAAAAAATSPPSPRTPPNAVGHSSFMHITPEQQQPAHSRMSRLWSRARAGLGAGRSPEEAKGGDARRGPKREKSARWRRGSVAQAREE